MRTLNRLGLVAKGTPTPNIMIAVPAYAGVSAGFFTSALQLTGALRERGIPHQFHVIAGDACIVHTRSDALHAFRVSGCTHLAMIDSDIAFAPEAVLAMIDRNEAFVACVSPKRAIDWGRLEASARAGRTDAVASALQYAAVFDPAPDGGQPRLEIVRGAVRCAAVGAAMVLLRRAVVDRLDAAHPELAYLEGGDPRTRYALFNHLVDGGQFKSEDFSFCTRWRRLGGEIWLLLDVPLEHAGPFKSPAISPASSPLPPEHRTLVPARTRIFA